MILSYYKFCLVNCSGYSVFVAYIVASVIFSCYELDMDEFQLLAIVVNEFIIEIGFGGCGMQWTWGCVLFCSNNKAVCGLIECVVWLGHTV